MTDRRDLKNEHEPHFPPITDQSLTLPSSPEFWSVLLLRTTSTHPYALHPPLWSSATSSLFSLQLLLLPHGALIYLLHTVPSFLKTNPYVVVLAIDFYKAFDSVRHSAVSLCLTNIPAWIFQTIFKTAWSHAFRITRTIPDLMVRSLRWRQYQQASYGDLLLALFPSHYSIWLAASFTGELYSEVRRWHIRDYPSREHISSGLAELINTNNWARDKLTITWS